MTQKQANILLVFVTMGWGSSYIFTKFSIGEVQPFMLVAFRFIIAFIVMALLFFQKIRHVHQQTIQASAVLGTILCGVFATFGFAMQTTSASTAGFLITTTVVFVPLIMVVIKRKLPVRKVMLGTLITFTGLTLLSLKDSFTFEIGIIYCLLTAFLYAIHIVANNYFARTVDAFQLGIFQLGFTGILGLIASLLFEPFSWPIGAVSWAAIVSLAIICSAFGFVVQSIAQNYTTPENTGFIFSLEPITAAIFAFLFLGEKMVMQEYIGATIILIGIFVANHTPKKRIEYGMN
ncbi:DMT family transporter [Peribacillus butanolivorans]|uniref:DMT family transporter n=1 Tax=Peribacillus butanolivorans TaxID=421767 RepID=UPI0036DB9661